MRRRDAFALGLAVAAIAVVRQSKTGRTGTQSCLNSSMQHGGEGTEALGLTDARRHKVRLETALQPLDTQVLRQRALDVFPAGYQTTISIIQGVSLSALTVTAVQQLAEGSGKAIALIPRAVVMLTMLILVSYQYIWFTTIMRWPMTFRDILVPYMLGAGEIVAALYVANERKWWIAVTVLTALGALAFTNTLSRLTPDAFERPDGEGLDEDPYKLVRNLLVVLICYSLVAVAVGFALCWVVVGNDERVWPGYTGLFILAVLSILMFRTSERGMNSLFGAYGIQRAIPLFLKAGD